MTSETRIIKYAAGMLRKENQEKRDEHNVPGVLA